MSCAKPPVVREFMWCGWPGPPWKSCPGTPPYPPPPPPRFGGKREVFTSFSRPTRRQGRLSTCTYDAWKHDHSDKARQFAGRVPLHGILWLSHTNDRMLPIMFLLLETSFYPCLVYHQMLGCVLPMFCMLPRGALYTSRLCTLVSLAPPLRTCMNEHVAAQQANQVWRHKL